MIEEILGFFTKYGVIMQHSSQVVTAGVAVYGAVFAKKTVQTSADTKSIEASEAAKVAVEKDIEAHGTAAELAKRTAGDPIAVNGMLGSYISLYNHFGEPVDEESTIEIETMAKGKLWVSTDDIKWTKLKPREVVLEEDGDKIRKYDYTMMPSSQVRFKLTKGETISTYSKIVTVSKH